MKILLIIFLGITISFFVGYFLLGLYTTTIEGYLIGFFFGALSGASATSVIALKLLP